MTIRRIRTVRGAQPARIGDDAPGRRLQLVALLVPGLLLAILEYARGASALAAVRPEHVVEWALRVGIMLLVDVLAAAIAFRCVASRRYPSFPLGLIVIAVSPLSMIGLFTGPAALVAIGARRRPREIVPAVAVALTAIVAGSAVRRILLPTSLTGQPAHWMFVMHANAATTVAVLAVGLVILLALALIGVFIGTRKANRELERERAERDRREAASNVAHARSEERTRIAREMHDSLGHHLALVSLHAGAIQYRDDLDGRELRAAVDVIAEKTRVASDELRGILGVLRGTDESEIASRRLRPTLADVREPVAEARASGTAVDLTLVPEEAVATVPASLGLHAYRFVQEALTNAMKHAPGERVHLMVRIAEGERIELAAWNRIPPASTAATGAGAFAASGFGLVGLGERVRLAGGECSVVSDGTLFHVAAWMPWSM